MAQGHRFRGLWIKLFSVHLVQSCSNCGPQTTCSLIGFLNGLLNFMKIMFIKILLIFFFPHLFTHSFSWITTYINNDEVQYFLNLITFCWQVFHCFKPSANFTKEDHTRKNLDWETSNVQNNFFLWRRNFYLDKFFFRIFKWINYKLIKCSEVY